MKNKKRIIRVIAIAAFLLIVLSMAVMMTACDSTTDGSYNDTANTKKAAATLQENQLTEGGSVVGRFTVDGKVSSLNSFLTPDSEYYEIDTGAGNIRDNKWLADVDGSYGENDTGIFFFTPDGKYVEWSGIYLYSDIPFTVEAPVINYTEVG